MTRFQSSTSTCFPSILSSWGSLKQSTARWSPCHLPSSLGSAESSPPLLKQVQYDEFMVYLQRIPTVFIETSKEYVKFSINGENGSGSITLKHRHDPEKKDESVTLEVDEPVNLSFALRYLNLFNKASNLSPSVILHLSNEVPLVVEYVIDKLGSLKFYLAPKINDGEGN